MGHHTNWDRCFVLDSELYHCIIYSDIQYSGIQISKSKVRDIESCSAEVKKIQDFHMGPQRNWWDIGYNFLIGEDGNIYEGRGFDAQGAHW